MSNPFEELATTLAALTGTVAGMQAAIARIERQLNQPKMDWERLVDSVRLRHVGRRTLLGAIADGRIRSKRIPGPGGQEIYLLRVEDLDTHYPLIIKRKKNPGEIPPRQGRATQVTLSPEPTIPAIL